MLKLKRLGLHQSANDVQLFDPRDVLNGPKFAWA